ncbi:sarcospan [Tribolium madens]|uniref:sarcospan n=1 Tax=Tribolium madens TaxID=41895 RepID=UPI001CF73F7E|nr:sarcospan [Tribolium madens]XP_044269414.1 sarcospan [Tribolium madens]
MARRVPADAKNGSRPVSFYDNCLENGNNTESLVKETQFDSSPTQAHCLMTTVPQNIAAQNIASKHTPNRNSLRHSRMIAMNKNGRVPRKYLPAIFRYHKLAKALLGLILLLGLSICFLSLWLLIWTPNIRQRDNPHWSGIPVLLSGIVGMVLVCCFRKEHPGMKKNYFVYAVKVLSVTLSTIGAISAFTASAFAVIHLVALYSMTCTPPGQLDTTCMCFKNDTLPAQSYHYVDLSCLEVDNILTILIIFSCAANLIVGVMEVWYVYLHWASRYVYTYSKVRTENDQPTVLQNPR